MAYAKAAEEWLEIWPDVQRETAGHSLIEAHNIIVDKADGILPFQVEGLPDYGQNQR